ncbi:MAG: hypothetical protein KJO98_15300 [Rhodothermia bacterium]|nr:hypothetical protein [Rhodothermia bacterium]
MQNKRLVRIQLAVLAALTILLVGRVLIGEAEPDGVVVISGVDVGELRISSFHLKESEPFLLEATGSLERKFESSSPLPALAAYPWIINRHSREVVWEMEPANVQVGSATAVHAATTLTLEPGHYDVFFTSFGNTRYSRQKGNMLKTLFGTHWTADKDRWHISLRSNREGGSSALPVTADDVRALAPTGGGLVWSSAPTKGYTKAHYVFSVESPARLRTYAVGELCQREECDIGWIEEVFSGRKVWELKDLNTRHAGGMKENRVGDLTLQLQPGVYRAVFKTDARHAWGDWIANPPFDPAAWGLTIFDESGGASGIASLDPWTQLQPILGISRVGNSERRQAQFEVLESANVVVHATGEITGSGSLYDHAWVRNDVTEEKVWEMSWAESYPAGGAKKNRQQMGFLRLDPGSYSVFYETDDSHAFDSWNSSRPDHPERWGVTLFAFGDRDAVQTTASTPVEIPTAPTPPSVPAMAPLDLPPFGSGRLLVDARELGNEADVEHEFDLDSRKRLRIVATGEISMSGRYDYAWIEKDDGTTVWEMTYRNTRAAGGEDANRTFDGIVELPAGAYVVRFTTDFSHAYADFGEDAPADPGSWGIRAEILPE